MGSNQFCSLGSDLAVGVPHWKVSEAQDRDWEAEQEAGKDQGSSWGHSQPRQEQEEENWAGRGEAEEHQQGSHYGQDEVYVRYR